MNTRDKQAFWKGAGLLTASSMVLLSGCGKEEPPPPPPKREAPPPPPPDPDPVQLSSLMGGADARVQFPQDKAPYDRSLAQAVIAFAGSLASGDDAALGDSLTLSGRGILDSMLADGTWFDATESIEAVRVVYLGQQPDLDEDAFSADFVLAVQEPGGAYTLGWNATETDGGWVMSPVPTADATLPRAADWDGDSIGQYASAAGWSGAVASGGGAAEGSGDGLAAFAALDTAGGKAYVIGLLVELMQSSSLPMTQDQLISAIAMQSGEDAGDIRDELEQGKSELDRVSDDQIRLGVEAAKMVFGAMGGQDVSDDDYVAAAAKVLGRPESEIREALG